MTRAEVPVRSITYGRKVSASLATVPRHTAAPALRGLGYNPALDGLRAVAILAVIAQHAGVPGILGYHGVTLFFVISGYLITRILLAEHDRSGSIDLRRFYARRFARLGPALVVVVAASVLWLTLTGTPISSYWGGIVGSLTYTTDLIQALFGNGNVGPYFQWSWSLGVEELFYLIWPISLLLLAKWHRFWASAVLLVAGVIACWVLRAFLIFDGAAHNRFYFAPDTNADALMLGTLLALVLVRWPHSRALRIAGRIVGPISLLALLLLIRPHWGPILSQIDGGGFGQAALASVGIVFWMATSPRGFTATALSWRPLVLIGKMSYGLYLWNLLSIFILGALTNSRPVGTWWGLAWFASLIGVAYLSWRFVETPLRKRWAPAPSAPARPKATPVPTN